MNGPTHIHLTIDRHVFGERAATDAQESAFVAMVADALAHAFRGVDVAVELGKKTRITSDGRDISLEVRQAIDSVRDRGEFWGHAVHPEDDEPRGT